MTFPYFEFTLGFILFVYIFETYLDWRQHARYKAAKPPKVKKKHPPLFVPDIMVARQRAMFMAQAQRRQAARAAAYARTRGRHAWDEEEDEAA